MRVSECVRLRLTSSERSGYLRASELGPDTFSGLFWGTGLSADPKRVVIDLTQVTGFGPGVVETIATQLVEAGVDHVQVEGDQKPGVRGRFREMLDQAITDAEKVLR